MAGPTERFTPEEARLLAPYFTNVDRPIFALTNLAETVKGALFARYSRSAKSLRRLFLDEFLGRGSSVESRLSSTAGTSRAEELYGRVLADYGDDSVAQLGGAHIACEGISNVLTKVLEWGRVMAYLEQSTRYVAYTDRPDGRWKYHVPAELTDARLRAQYTRTLDTAFEVYARTLPTIEAYWRERYPRVAEDSEAVYRTAIRSKALDTLRGLLPAATQSNVGIFGSGQAFEMLLLRLLGHPLEEARTCGRMMLDELRQVIPAFLVRVDQPGRGGRWIQYLAETRRAFAEVAHPLVLGELPASAEVTLTDFDPDGETKIVAAALYSVSELSDERLMAIARSLSEAQRASLLRAYAGQRGNRRHKPGRALERTSYRFDVLTDYGAFRDLQRHRMLTIDWQSLSTRHGYVEPEAIAATGGLRDWRSVMDQSADLYETLVAAGLTDIAPYGVVMAYRIRFSMEMNAREAMHVIELRTGPQGHPSYRRVCQLMHRAIAEVAGHRAIADAMRFVDHSEVELERLQAERSQEAKRRQRMQE